MLAENGGVASRAKRAFGVDPPESATMNCPRAAIAVAAIAANRRAASSASPSPLGSITSSGRESCIPESAHIPQQRFHPSIGMTNQHPFGCPEKESGVDHADNIKHDALKRARRIPVDK